jgi:hypothetical protein
LRDLILNQKDVIESARVGVGPEILSRPGVAQLRCDAHLIARLAHAASENVLYAKRRPDGA